jgi:acetyl-CoA C-acetyltransferase
MEKVCREAFLDAGNEKVRDLVDSLQVVNLFQWPYRDAPGMLAEKLGLGPGERYYTPIGGNTPQLLVNRACRALAAGRVRAVLITGAEAVYSVRRALKGELRLDWPKSEPPGRIDGEERQSVSDLEGAYDLFFPATMYPLIETAIRAASGRAPDEHRLFMAGLWERLSKVAAANPHAWSRVAMSASEIAAVTPDNRYIAYPYVKHMVANINVDQGAAVLLTTTEEADRLGISREKRVFPLGGGDFYDVWYVTRRPSLDRSPAIRHASRIALDQAGLEPDDIDAFDLYSCFPSAVQIAMREMGISETDPRPISLTGGLSFFGGPGNNYSLHAIAEAAQTVRRDRGKKVLVNANGWYITKHSVGVYGGEPPVNPWVERDDSSVQRAIDAEALPEPEAEARGVLRVEAYVIRHDSAGEPALGTVLGRLADGSRTLAHIQAGKEELLEMERTELVGAEGRVGFSSELVRNIVSF